MKKWTALLPAAFFCAPAFGQLQLPGLSTQQLSGTLNQTLSNPLGGSLDAAGASVTRGAGSIGTSALPVQPGVPAIDAGRAGVAGLQPVDGLDRTRIDASGSNRGAFVTNSRGGTQGMQAFRIGDRVFIAPDLESARAMAGIDQRAGGDASASIGPGGRAAVRASQQGSLAAEERAALNLPGTRVDQQGAVRVDERAGGDVSDRTVRQLGQSARGQARDGVRAVQQTGARAVSQARGRTDAARESVPGRLQTVNDVRDRVEDRARNAAGQARSGAADRTGQAKDRQERATARVKERAGNAVDRATDRLPAAEGTANAIRQ